MSAPVLDFGGWVLRSPVTVGTNLLLASQALWLVAALEADPGASRRTGRPWVAFLRLLALATAVGAVKHGTEAGSIHEAARVVSGVATGALVALACVVTIRVRTAPGVLRRGLLTLVGFKLALLVGAVVTWPSFLVVAADAALGLGPVLVVEAHHALRGRADAVWVAAGLAAAGLGGVIYLLPLRVGVWVDSTDLAHGVLFLALPLLARADRTAGDPEAVPLRGEGPRRATAAGRGTGEVGEARTALTVRHPRG